ncbi:MAG: type II restriction endonuclease [Oxalobacter formigenes]|nr:type II restriction endonuclease [Oxalobacter formigenes]
MENTNAFINQPLFHDHILAPLLKDGTAPSAHQRLLGEWAKNLAALNKQDKPAQQAAFFQQILSGILGYQAAGGNARTLESLPQDAWFDAALGRFDTEPPRMTAMVKLMGPSSFNLDTVSGSERLNLIEQARRQAKNLPGRQFLILSNLDEVRLYSLTHKRTTYEQFFLSDMAGNAAACQRFFLLLNAENLLSGKTAQWLNDSIAAGLKEKLTQKHATVRDIYGPLQSGPAVTINDVFVIDKKTYDSLVNEDPKSADILMAFYDGGNLRRWHADTPLHWLIYTPKGKVDINAYPAVKKYLEPHREALEKQSSGRHQWYELDYEETDIPLVTDLRLGVGRRQAEPGFVLGEKGAQYGSESHYIPNADYFLFGLLNSTAIAKLLRTLSEDTGNRQEIPPGQIESLPVPNAGGLVRARVGQLSQFCMEKTQDRRDIIHHFRGMTAFNLSPEKLEAKLSDKLLNWFAHDFDTFRSEIIASFGTDIPADDLLLWTDYFNQERNRIYNMNSELVHAEGELDRVIYQLFDLDDDDIALIEQD